MTQTYAHPSHRIQFFLAVPLWKFFATTLGILGTLSSALLAQPARELPAEDPSKPWILSAPSEIQKLLVAGDVQFQRSDRLLKETGKLAMTQFKISVDYKYSLQQKPFRGSRLNNAIAAEVRFRHPVLQVHHIIHLPSSFQPEAPWESKTLLHEMDHVAISTDPRWKQLVDGVFSRPIPLTVEEVEGRNSQELQEIVAEKAQRLVTDMESLIQCQYDALDSKSRQGHSPIEDKGTFVSKLFSREQLEQSNAGYLKEIPEANWNRWSNYPAAKLERHYQTTIKKIPD